MNNELNNLKKSLDDFLSKKRQKELSGDRETLIKETAIEVSKVFKPILEAMSLNSRISREELRNVADDIASKINIPEINVPEIVMPDFPKISVPEPRVTVNFDASKIRVPEVVMPDMMDIKGMVSLDGIDYEHPLPVTLRDKDGKAVDLATWTTAIVGGGGKSDFFTIKGFGQSAFSVPVNSDGEVKVSGTFVAGAVTSAYVIVGNSEMLPYNSDNPMPVYLTSGASATTAVNIVDSNAVAYSGSNPLPISDAGGSITVDGTFWQATQPVSGNVAVSGVTGSIGATILNGEGVARDTWGSTQVGTWNVGTVTTVTGVTNTIASANIDSSGVQYSGSNPMPTYLVLGSGNSTVTVGPVADGGTDDGSSPVKIGAIARTANPTAHTGGQTTSLAADDLGRQLTRPIQVRDLISTAYVSKTTGSTFGTETTLFAGATNTYHDLIYVLASNDSTAAIGVDIRGTLAGNILLHLEIPANSTTGLSLPVPLPAGDVGASWTIDLPDVTGTNVYVSALFSKEV